MTERDYDRLLDTVQSAINPIRQEKRRPTAPAVPAAANDNSEPWPLMPFPEGWNASP